MRLELHLLGGCLVSVAALAATGCAPQVEQGGANTNDRTNGGPQGEVLLTGAMSVSADGKFAIVQRNQTTVLLDIEARTTRELPVQVSRFIFAKSRPLAFAVLPQGAGVTAYELPTLDEVWHAEPSLAGEATLARLSDDDAQLVLGDAADVLVLDAKNGEARGRVAIGSMPDQLAFSSRGHAFVVGTVAWSEHRPSTRIVDIDLATLETASVEVPNCNAPLAILPDGSRAFMSPTFCEEHRAEGDESEWTNPDPVSVIDLGARGPVFVKNLPGFGPVALAPDASRVVAYLDVERMDESMFDDPSDIPDSGERFHIMTIDPRTLAFELAPVGDVLPRFVMTADGRKLLVDATVQQFRTSATLTATVDANGNIVVDLALFGGFESLFGVFDLDTQTYVPFSGRAPLDRFVQMGDGRRVFTLVTRADGMGGDLTRIDLDLRAATPLNRSLRDIGLLADGQTLLLRERLPAVQVTADGQTSWYRREHYCFSLDGIGCIADVEFQDAAPFQTGPTCNDYHDC